MAERWPESAGDEELAESGARYLVRNASQRARQAAHLRERFSGRLRPEAVRSVEAFDRDTTLLRAWALPPGRVRPVFAQPDVELRLLPPPEGGSSEPAVPDVAIPFPRPTLVLPAGIPLYDASGSPWFGPRIAIRTVGRRGTIRFAADGAPRWAVTRLPTTEAEGGTPVRVKREGPFRPAASALAPGGVAVALARPPSPASAVRSSVFPKARIRVRGDDQRNAAFTFLAADPAEAAMELRRAGDGAAALALLREGGGPKSATARVEAFLDAVASGTAPDPEWEAAARDALAAWDALAAAAGKEPFPDEATVCGVPLRALLDFSRFRHPDVPVGPRASTRVAAPPGTYRVECRVEPRFADRLAGLILFEGQTGPFEREDAPDGEAVVLRAEIRKTGDGLLRFSESAPDPFAEERVALDDLEISWDPLAFVAESAEALRRALFAGSGQASPDSSPEQIHSTVP